MMGEKMDEQPSSSASVPQKNWELANQIVDLDSIYDYNEKEQLEIRNAKPWEKDQHLFKEVKISAVALLKMVMHAKRGGNLEVMGLMQGRVEGNAFLVMDSFALPVEGTETRVNAQSAAYEYMTVFTDLCETVGKKEKVVGWYHSHPGYGCWLSGIDVATQSLNQQFQEPWVAIVIDPLRTMSAGKVDIGAFRTYPKGYNPPDDGPSEYQTIPLEKIEDFGVHCKQYYSLDVSFFKSELDSHVLNALWNTYWLNTLTSSPLLSNAAYINNQITDVGSKMKNLEKKWSRGDRSADLGDQLEKAVRDARNIGTELVSSLMIQQLKRSLFNHRCCAHEAENGPAEMPVDEHVPPVQPDAADPNVVAGAMAVHQLVDAVAVQEEPQDMVVEPAQNEMEAAETAQK